MVESMQGNFCNRPDRGVDGAPNSTLTNYFPIELRNLRNIHHFDVSISPEVPKKINLAIFEQFENQYLDDPKVFGNTCMVYDGMKGAFSPRPMAFGENFSTEISFCRHPESRQRGQSYETFLLKLRKVSTITVDIEDMHAENSSGLTSIMAFNILFIYSLKSKFFTLNNACYLPEGARPISGGLEVWPGFSRSFVAIADGLALNVDISSCVFYRSGNLLDLLVSYVGLRTRDELRDPRFWQHLKRIQGFLSNLRVVFNYRNGASHSYKIIGLSASGADTTEFTLSEEGAEDRQVTVQEYFARKFGIRLEFPSLPCIQIKKGNLIPMELCQLTPGQRYPKKLNDIQTAEMIKITCISPNERSEKVCRGLRLMDLENNTYLKHFGIRVLPTLKQVETRLLPAPYLLYHPSSRDSRMQPVDGAWNLRDKKVCEARELHTWAVIVFASESRIRRGAVENFMTEYVGTCLSTGLHISNRAPNIFYAPSCALDRISSILCDIYVATGNAAKMRPQMLICILPDKGADLYGAIKTTCELELGIPTQCIQSDKIMRPNKQYCANVCLKMNAKLGGINASLQERDLAELKDPPTLLLGADTSELLHGSDDNQTAAAVIGSVDFGACRYASEISYQKSGEDCIVNLQEMVVNLLRAFYKASAAKPKQIIYFRDGVSNGKFQKVLASEMRAIKGACRSLEDSYNPKVTFVMIQKRHSTRFFPVNKSAMDRSGNCKAGTLVETGICHPYYFDFFLQSHSGLQGTSRPVHYYVLVNEINFSSDRLQRLCYNLCYLFNRATRAVSIVPPIYYAHLAATRAVCHLKALEFGAASSNAPQSTCVKAGNPSNHQLSDVMYYI